MSCSCSGLVKNPHNHDAPSADAPLVNVQIDGQWVQVPKGLNVIEAARRHGKFIPHYCYHPKLSVPGNCRMCLVELGSPKMDANRQPVLGQDGKPEIAWNPRPQISCAATATEGMAVRTGSPLVEECRKGVLEFLLINHPLDCPICDEAGECRLQEFSVQYGNAGSRFVEEKVHKPKAVDLGKKIVLDDERCILCSRCIRFTDEFAHDPVLGFTERGSHTTLTAHPGQRFDNEYSLNTVDICPVGALTSKDFRFQMRVWFLKETKSLCTGCSTGCNVTIGSREGKVYRLTPRINESVNSHWMCDTGRLGFHYLQDARRITQPQARVGSTLLPIEWSQAFTQIRERLQNVQPAQIGILLSARMTNEEIFLAAELRRALSQGDAQAVTTALVPRPTQADGLLRGDDLNPNTAGAALLGFDVNQSALEKLTGAAASGKLQALLVFHEDARAAGIPLAALQQIPLHIHCGLLENGSSVHAHYLLPGAGFAEKRGTMINRGGRLQRLQQAITTPGSARDDLEILLALLHAFNAHTDLRDFDSIFAAMTAATPALAGLTWGKIGEQGIDLPSQS